MSKRLYFKSGLEFLIISCSLLFGVILRLQAQSIVAPKTPRTHAGTDFWLTIPPNFHTAQLAGDDKISLFIAAERPTEGEIRFGDSAGQATTLRFTITNPAQIFRYEIPAQDIELRLNEQISNRSVHILTDSPVSVYALNTASQSADGTIVFPVHAAGTRFIALTYPSDDGAGIVPATPSQLGIVATADSTHIRITPSAPTKVHGRTPHEIVLQRGETYLMQADVRPSTAADLTGTTIISDRPIAVFSSQERANVPLSSLSQAGTRSISRDYLLEQILPDNFWGKRIFIPPLPQPQTTMSDATNHSVRVVARADSTVIRINGQTAATLQAGQMYEATLASMVGIRAHESGLVIEGSAPIFAAVFASSNGSGSGIGDPFMLAVPPEEQFLRSVRTVNIRSIQRISSTITEEAFREHYLSIIVPLSSVPSVLLDNQRLAPNTFQRFSISSDYAFANVRVSEGLHTVSADTTVGVIAIGYGNATSYGYTAGQRLEPDNTAPQIVTQALCNAVRVTVYDSAQTDSKLYRVFSLDSLQKNLTLSGLERLDSPDSLTFTARLTNPYQDGTVTVLALDSLGQTSTKHITIPGLTVHADSTLQAAQVLSSSATLVTGRSVCFQLPLVNYGTFPQRIDSVIFLSRHINVTTTLPIVLQPGERRTVEYCLRTLRSGVFSDTLALRDSCTLRPILAIRVEAFSDTQEPSVTETVGDCERSIEYRASDSRRFDSGVDSVKVLTTTNCTVQTQRRSDDTVQIRISLPNRRNDASYRIAVSDSAGNVRILERQVPGFRVRISLAGAVVGATAPILVSGATTQVLTCATLLVENLSAYPLQLDNLRLTGNIIFSLPPSELPFFVAAGETKPLHVCFAPNVVANFRDTLVLEKFCERENIAIVGTAVEEALEAMSRCNTLVRLSPRRTVIALRASLSPQPASDVVALDITTLTADAPSEERVIVRFFDIYGAERQTSRHTLSAQLSPLSIPITNLPAGQYMWQMVREQTAEQLASGSAIILR